MQERSERVPMWLWGTLCAIVLIVLSIWGRGAPAKEALSQAFAAQPTPVGLNPALPLPHFELGSLPVNLQQPARDLLTALGAGKPGRPVEPSATTPRLRIEINELRPTSAGLQLVGVITNSSQAELTVPISAFELRDSTGATYIAGGGASATLRAGESTPLELTVPLPAGRGLLLVTNFPPDAPVEQRLIVVDK